MFGKIKDRLKNVFSKSEEVIEENPDEVLELEDKTPKESPKKKEKVKVPDEKETPNETVKEIQETEIKEEKEEKKGLFSGMFKKKKEESEIDEVSQLQDDMLEDVDNEEKLAIKEKKELSKEKIKDNKAELESKIKEENKTEIEELKEIKEEKEEKKGFFSKAFSAIKQKKITEEDFEKIWIELEIFLLEINIAYEIVEKIEQKLRESLVGNSFDRFNLSKKIREVLESEVEQVLSGREGDFLELITEYKKKEELLKILVLGVNGTGKTTTIAKIVRFLQKNNFTSVVAAADTFRAAAVEQLEGHSKNLGFKLIQHKGGSDPAAVSFDAIEHAKAKKLNIVLIDTAGRMPNNSNLMMELLKVKRVSNAQMAVFVGDSISGNDLIEQIDLFNKGVNIDGVILTKVDTDERPGSIVTTAYSIDKPIYFLGVGQNYDDLIVFNAKDVAEKLFSLDDEED